MLPTAMAAAPRKLRYLYTLSLGLSVATFLFLLGLNLRAISDIERAAPTLEQLQQRDLLLGYLAEHLLEMQAARRGYILTEHARFLQDMDRSWVEWNDALRRLQASAKPLDDAAADELEAIGGLAQQYAASLQVSVALHRRQPQALAQQQQITLEGDVLSREVQSRITTARAVVARRIAVDSGHLMDTTRRVRVGEIVLAATGVLLLLLAGGLASAEIRKRHQAQAALSRVNADLEAMVELRTAAQQAASARYRRLVELSADGILLCDALGIVQYANPAAISLMDCAADAPLTGRVLASLFSLQEPDLATASLQSLWTQLGVNALVESALRTDQGQIVPVRIAAVSYLENDALHVQLVVHDIRRLRQEEAARKDQLLFIDQLLEAIPNPLSVRDERGVYLRVNQAYEDLYGRPRDELLQRPVFDAFDYALASDISFHDHAAMRSLETLTYETQLRQAIGVPRELLASVRAFRRADASVIGVISVETDVTDMRRQRNELQRISAQRERLSKRLLQAQEDERRRIARELHDQVGQILTALKMSLDLGVASATDQRALFERPAELADEALSHVRGLTSALHPHVLEDLGLEAAIHWLSERYVRNALPSLRVTVEVVPPRALARTELVAFRIVQEALTNVMRHAGACSAQVSVRSREDGMLAVCVQDDGPGFDVSAHAMGQSGSLGLASMRERLEEIGGTLSIDSAPGRGTSVSAEMPW